MFYIRMKMATLGILLALFVLVCVWLVFALPGFLMQAGRYEAVIHYFPFSLEMPSALYQEAQHIVSSEPPMLYIFPGNENVEGGQPVTADQVEQAKRDLLRIVQHYPDFVSISQVDLLLANADQANGNWDGAKQIYAKLAQSSGPDASQAKLLLAKLNTANTGNGAPGPGGEAQGTGNSGQGAGSPAQGTDSRAGTSSHRPLVTGKVTVNGHPVSHAYVFLRQTANKNMFSSDVESSYPGAFTNAEGVYMIDSAPSDDYQVAVGVRPSQVTGSYLPLPLNEQIHVDPSKSVTYNLHFVPQIQVESPTASTIIHGDQIHFTWKPYPGAAYYTLQITDFLGDPRKENFSSVGLNLPKRYTTAQANFSMKQLRSSSGGVVYGDGKLSPASVLGLVYPGGTFSWSVDAYDAKGVQLSSSRGYFADVPLFSVDSKGASTAQKYAASGDWVKAKAAYLKQGNTPAALRALGIIELYGAGSGGSGGGTGGDGGAGGASGTSGGGMGSGHGGGTGWQRPGDPAQALKYFDQIPNPSADVKEFIKEAKRQLASGNGT